MQNTALLDHLHIWQQSIVQKEPGVLGEVRGEIMGALGCICTKIRGEEAGAPALTDGVARPDTQTISHLA